MFADVARLCQKTNMAKAAEYRAKAQEFEREAARVMVAAHREHYLTLAAAWRDMAAAAELSEALNEERSFVQLDREPS